MMTQGQIRKLIVERLEKMEQGSPGSVYLAHQDGVFRGLLWVLTGTDPGTDATRNTLSLLTSAGIPARIEGGKVIHSTPDDDDWPKP